MVRGTVSPIPPGGYGTITRTGLFGYGCANTALAVSTQHVVTQIASTRVSRGVRERVTILMLVLPMDYSLRSD